MRKSSLTEGSIWKHLFWFSLPLIFSNLLQVLFNMADVAVVGRFAGSGALGSVGSTTILINLFTGLIIGMGSGVSVIVARAFGAKDVRAVEETVHTSAIFCFGLGLLVAVIGVGLARPILQLLGTKAELMEGAVLYFRIYCLGMPALGLYNFGHGVLSATGDTKRPLYFLSVAGVVNVLLNLFFVIVCKMSVAGVAIASIISQYISAVLILCALTRTTDCYRLSFSKLCIVPKKAKEILGLGIPCGFQNAIFSLANLFVQGGVNTFSATVVAGNAAATNADGIVYNVMDAFYIACGSFIGQNYGAGKRDRIRKTFLVSLTYAFGSGLLIGVGLLLCGRSFLSVFTADAEVLEAGMHRLTVMGLSYAWAAFMDTAIAASRGLGKGFVPTVIVILGSCVFRVIWIYTVFAYFQTIVSIYLLYIFSWSITAVAEILYFVRVYRKKVRTMQEIE